MLFRSVLGVFGWLFLALAFALERFLCSFVSPRQFALAPFLHFLVAPLQLVQTLRSIATVAAAGMATAWTAAAWIVAVVIVAQ